LIYQTIKGEDYEKAFHKTDLPRPYACNDHSYDDVYGKRGRNRKSL
jgi:hypothetical protein